MRWELFGGAAALLFSLVLLVPNWKEMAERRRRALFTGKVWGVRRFFCVAGYALWASRCGL